MPEDFEYVDGLEDLKRLCDEQGLDHMDSEAAACETVIFVDREGNPHECWEAGSDGRINVTIVMTPEQAVAVTSPRDEGESYDAGFTNGVKATLQQLYGLLHEYPTLDEIEAWADSQWEEYE